MTPTSSHGHPAISPGSRTIPPDRRFGRPSGFFLACLLVGLASPPAVAGTLEDEIRAMRAEIRELRQELDALRGEVRQGRPVVQGQPAEAKSLQASPEAGAQSQPSAPPGPAGEPAPSGPEVIPTLQAQIAEQAQTKVESNSKLPVKIFGTVISSTFFNTGEADWIEIPGFVPRPPDAPFPKGSFNFSLRQSRIGTIFDGPQVGSLKTTGFFAMDFFGGDAALDSAEYVGLPRLLYAYMRLEGEKTVLEFGQDEMILAPRNPTSLAAMAVPDLYRSGNLYGRVPQVRVERRFAAGSRGEWRAALGVLAPLGGYLGYDYYPTVRRSREPAVQARVAWAGGEPGREERPRWELGFSSHYERQHYSTGPEDAWAGAVDFDVRGDRLGFGGEWYAGRNLQTFGGALGQRAKSTGGFLEGRVRGTRRLEFNAGFGADHLFDLGGYPVALGANSSVFANTIFRFTPELATSFEYRWLRTTPEQGVVRHNNHFNFVFAYSF